MPIDRRDFMVGGALAAGGVMMANMNVATPAFAASEKKVHGQTIIYTTKVGEMEIHAILDGPMQMDSSVFYQPDEAALAQAKADHFLKADAPFPAYLNCFLIQSNGKKTLIDTGGRSMTPQMGQLTKALGILGADPHTIDTVIITHAHPDHTNGLLTDQNGRTFSKADVKIAEEELAFWFSDENAAKFSDKKMMFDLARKNLGPYKESGQISTFKADSDLGGGLSSVFLPGHTPGHSGIRVSDGNEQLLIWADIVHSAFVQFENPDQSMVFDIDPALARETRKKIFEQTAADKIRVGGMHLIFPALGHVVKRGDAYALEPQHWEVG